MVDEVNLSFAESAVHDLEEIRDYYIDQHVPEIGERFLLDIISAVQKLTDHPDRGRIVPEFNQPFLRELILPPFRMFIVAPPRVSASYASGVANDY